MKNKPLLFLPIFIVTLLIWAQGISQETFGGENPVSSNNSACLSVEQRESIQSALKASQSILKSSSAKNLINANQDVQFIWPIQQAEGFNYNSTWAISNYVDQDPSNSLQDFNCGTRTYDNHNGLDIYLWPFQWKQMEENQTEIIAAASGTIVYKSDGYFDQQCSFNFSPWNAVYVEHSDGSVAWYGHMKEGSLTDKNVGDTVSQGEFLGVVGSSGNSTAPHLHFEVYDADNNLIDPYQGSCNDLNDESWWVDQRDYTTPKINAVLTHSGIPEFFNCPGNDNLRLENEFDPNSQVICAAYFADQQIGTTATFSVYNPSGERIYNWTRYFNTYYSSSYWIRDDIYVDDTEGTWRFEVSYLGEVVSHNFIVGDPQQQTPFKTHNIPGLIEAEDYDNGGPGIAYTDNDSQNSGKQYRTNEEVDIEFTEDSLGTYNVGWTADGESLEYTISDVQEGVYDIDVRIAKPEDTFASIDLTLDNTYLGSITIPQTGGWQNWQTISLSNISIPQQSDAVLKLQINDGRFNLNYVDFKLQNNIPIGKYISLQKSGGDQLYVAAEDANNRLIADRSKIGAWEKFLIVAHPNGGVALKANANGLYIQVPEFSTSDPVIPRGSELGDLEQFEWKSMGDGKVALKSMYSGKWLQAAWNENKGIVRARGNNSLTWETFNWNEESVAQSKSLASQNIALSISPNPTPDKLFINISSTQESHSGGLLYVFDSVGKNVKTISLSGSSEVINISDFKSGIYFVRIVVGASVLQEKIIKR